MNIESGTRLLTKDGRSIGNAIVIHEFEHDGEEKIWVIETDFGNIIRKSESEINDLWYINEPDELEIDFYGGSPLIRWMTDRYRLVTGKVHLSPAGRSKVGHTAIGQLEPTRNLDSFTLKPLGKTATPDHAKSWADNQGYQRVSQEYVSAVTLTKREDTDGRNNQDNT